MGTSMFRHAALAATGVAAIFAATAARGQDPVKIGFITELTGPWSFTGASCVAEYDVPADAWYFHANRAPLMPFSVLLEIASHPHGWSAISRSGAISLMRACRTPGVSAN